jgi:tetratricopeptide (TPR) repeat protein
VRRIALHEYLDKIEGLLDDNRLPEAAAHCHFVLQQYPRQVGAYRLFGRALLEQQLYEDAIDVFERLLSADPEDLISHAGLALAYSESRDLERAIWHMERAFEVDPYNRAVQDELRKLYITRDGDAPPRVGLTKAALARLHARAALFQLAAAEYANLVAQQPERVDYRLALAETLYRDAQVVEAAMLCQDIVREMPYCIKANAIVADAWLREDRTEEARPFLRRVQELTMLDHAHLDQETTLGMALGNPRISLPKSVQVEVLEDPLAFAKGFEESAAWRDVPSAATVDGEAAPDWLYTEDIPANTYRTDRRVSEATKPEPVVSVDWLDELVGTGVAAPPDESGAAGADIAEAIGEVEPQARPEVDADFEALLKAADEVGPGDPFDTESSAADGFEAALKDVDEIRDDSPFDVESGEDAGFKDHLVAAVEATEDEFADAESSDDAGLVAHLVAAVEAAQADFAEAESSDDAGFEAPSEATVEASEADLSYTGPSENVDFEVPLKSADEVWEDDLVEAKSSEEAGLEIEADALPLASAPSEQDADHQSEEASAIAEDAEQEFDLEEPESDMLIWEDQELLALDELRAYADDNSNRALERNDAPSWLDELGDRTDVEDELPRWLHEALGFEATEMASEGSPASSLQGEASITDSEGEPGSELSTSGVAPEATAEDAIGMGDFPEDATEFSDSAMFELGANSEIPDWLLEGQGVLEELPDELLQADLGSGLGEGFEDSGTIGWLEELSAQLTTGDDQGSDDDQSPKSSRESDEGDSEAEADDE